MSPSYLPGKEKIPGGVYYKNVLVAIRDEVHKPIQGNVELAKWYVDKNKNKDIVHSLVARCYLSKTAQRISYFNQDITKRAKRTNSLEFLEETKLGGKLEFKLAQILEDKLKLKNLKLGKKGEAVKRNHLRIPEESIIMPARRNASYGSRNPANNYG